MNLEVSLEVDITADLAFWVDKAQWNGLTQQQRAALIYERISEVASELDNDVLRFRNANISAMLLDEPGEHLADKVNLYDPEET